MARWRATVDSIAGEPAFSGVIRVDRAGEIDMATAYGLADRAHGIPNTLDTQFGIASGTKGFTALAVMSLVEDGVCSISRPRLGRCSARICLSSAMT